MREQAIQAKRIKQLEKDGYYVLKLVQTNKNGIPDLLAIKGDGSILFSEIKTKIGRLSSLQKYRIKELEELGFTVEIFKGL
tara:strand:- start:152 stop:394 length:243 start_codon:yes stop_codon:yes gene_type:complete